MKCEGELSFDDFRERLDIQDVLIDAGYQFYRPDGLRYPTYIRLDSLGKKVSGDKFVVMPNGKSCFKPPERKVYGITSFIAEHPHLFKEYRAGMDPIRLVNLVCNRLLNHPIENRMQRIVNPNRNVKPFNINSYHILSFQKYNFDNIKKFYPFFASRKIDLATQRAFSAQFMLADIKVTKNSNQFLRNLAFPLRVPGKEDIVGLEERGRPRLDGTSGYKGKALGSNSSEGLWIASPSGTKLKDAKDVLWFESAYDAMAYYQLSTKQGKNMDNAVFLSTGGNPTVMQYRGVIKEARNACHHLCFDNDLAGRQFAQNFELELNNVKKELPKVGEDMKLYMDTLRDANDYHSGDHDYLPKNIREVYDKYWDASDELYSMTHSGLCFEGDIKEQENLASSLFKEYNAMMREKLCFGCEQGHLKEIGTYDIPEWALCAIENGDMDGLSDEEERLVKDFMDEKFPEGYVSSIDWDNYNELNARPAFGERNKEALTSHGESPYLALKTYSVKFLHPTLRDGEALPNLTVKREVPESGFKDWNEQLIETEKSRESKEQEKEGKVLTTSAGMDMDGNGEIDISESEERKQHRSMAR